MKKAVDLIEKRGALLVFPIQNRPEPASLWREMYPRSKMTWAWDENGDDRVAKLWSLRENLSRSNQVVYTKWYKGRATFFSQKAFTQMRAIVNHWNLPPLSRTAEELLTQLQESSPLSLKKLKELTDLRGRDNEGIFTRGLRELWERFLIVGYGEFDDGAFPSLGLGSAALLFEDLCSASDGLDPQKALRDLTKCLGADSLFLKELFRLRKKLTAELAEESTLPS